MLIFSLGKNGGQMKKNRISVMMLVLLLAAFASGCTEDNTGKGPSGVNDALLEKYDDIEKNETIHNDGMIDILAVISAVDMNLKQITVKTVVATDKTDYNYAQKEYELKYTGGTDIRDSYDSIISVSQLKVGDVVNVTYNAEIDKVSKIQISKEVFVLGNATNVEVSVADKTVTYGKNVYQYTGTTVVLDNGQIVPISSIDKNDVLTIRGSGKKIYSVTVDKGHGYLKLSGHHQFIDGYIEIGESRVLKVTKEMTIPVTEGQHKVILSNGGVTAVKNITIKRGETTLAEFEEYLQEPEKQGSVKFILVQKNASLYIDGKKVDHTSLVELEYGIHTMTIVAYGYETAIETFIVDTLYQELKIDLDGDSKNDEESTSEKESASEKETTSQKESEKATEKK